MALKFGDWQQFIDNAVKVLDCPSRLKAFKRCKSLSGYVRFTQTVRPIRDQEWIDAYFKSCTKGRKSSKSAENSTHWRNEGNEFFQRNLNERALECYNKSVIKAPCNTIGFGNGTNQTTEPEISLAFANRSAALFHLKKYQHCLEDIRLAFLYHYPPRLKYKLFQRRGQCYMALNEYDQATEAFEEGCKVICLSDLNEKKRETVEAQLRRFIKESQNRQSSNAIQSCTPSCTSGEADVTPVYGFSPVLVQASDALTLQYSAIKGRHVVAGKTVNAGDVLIVEKPYAAVLLPSHYSTHCHHCFGKLVAWFPCCYCNEVKFCSQTCHTIAWETYHKYECIYMDMFHSIGIAHLSLRIVLVSGLANLIDFHDQHILAREKTKCIDGLTEKGTFERNYLSVYSLMPHETDMHPDDLFQYAITAALLLECLNTSGFFQGCDVDKLKPEVTTPPLSEDGQAALVTGIISQLKCSQSRNIGSPRKSLNSIEDVKVFIGGLLLRHICQLVCNAHAITELSVTESVGDIVDTTDQVRIATAIYPTASMLNHSCDPTIISSFQNDTLVVRAVREVREGEEIYNCYGPHCKRMVRSERQQCLKEQYFFDCVCDACESEEVVEDKYKALKCPHCSGPLSKPDVTMKCYDCGRTVEATKQMKTVLTSHDVFLDGVSLMKDGKNEEALEKLLKCLKLRASVLYKYNKDLAEVQDAVARCYALLGRFKEATKVLVDSVKTSSVIYGGTSIELGNEKQKYAELLYHAGQPKESRKIAEDALSIFELNYGPKCDAVKELKELLSALDGK